MYAMSSMPRPACSSAAAPASRMAGERCSSGRSERNQWSLPSAPASGKTQRSSGTPAARAAATEHTMKPAPWSTCMLAVQSLG